MYENTFKDALGPGGNGRLCRDVERTGLPTKRMEIPPIPKLQRVAELPAEIRANFDSEIQRLYNLADEAERAGDQALADGTRANARSLEFERTVAINGHEPRMLYNRFYEGTLQDGTRYRKEIDGTILADDNARHIIKATEAKNFGQNKPVLDMFLEAWNNQVGLGKLGDAGYIIDKTVLVVPYRKQAEALSEFLFDPSTLPLNRRSILNDPSSPIYGSRLYFDEIRYVYD